MTKEEKLDLKKELLPVLNSVFDSEKKNLLRRFPFLEFNDEDIEDDPEIATAAMVVEPTRIRDFLQKPSNLSNEFTKISRELSGRGDFLIQQIDNSAKSSSVDHMRGIMFTEASTMNRKRFTLFWSKSSRGSFMFLPVPQGFEAEAESVGYKSLEGTIALAYSEDQAKESLNRIIEQQRIRIEELERRSAPPPVYYPDGVHVNPLVDMANHAYDPRMLERLQSIQPDHNQFYRPMQERPMEDRPF